MTQVIIFKNDEGGVSVIYPTQDALTFVDIDTIAKASVPAPKKIYDVPTGVFETDPDTLEAREVMDFRIKEYPYKIVDITELPTDGTLNELGVPNIDKTFRAQWEVDEADLTDGVGAEFNDLTHIVGANYVANQN